MKELYKVHRPKKVEGLIGQPEAVETIKSWIKQDEFPHTILLYGPSGCGKTTLARIIRRHLKCSESSDYYEINSANFRGIDTIREIQNTVSLSPMSGESRVWVLDEAHQMSKDAQDGVLKLLEDTPGHAYFILCTTIHMKLSEAIRTRCTPIQVKRLANKVMLFLLQDVASKEGKTFTSDVLDKIILTSNGSARQALVSLNKIKDMTDEDDQLASIEPLDAEKKANDLYRALSDERTTFTDAAKVLRELQDENAEGLRMYILAAAKNCLLSGKGKAGRAAFLIECFECNLYDSGHAGLALACYKAKPPKGK